MPRCFSQQY